MMPTQLLNVDCMEYMKNCGDNFFDLAICDPPYGIGFGEFNRTNKLSDGTRVKADKYKNAKWDNAPPTDEYFKELIRVSRNQIVWGGNYFNYLAKKKTTNLKTKNEFDKYIEESKEQWIFWYKQNPVPNFADGELAWISFKDNSQFNFRYYGNIQGSTNADPKIHPTQKPIQLYKWLLRKYAKPGQRIIDTHLGSGSSAIAAHYFGCDFVGLEIDIDYFEAAQKRFANETRQVTMF
jgi:site-specific DNA-methyltransferase (adenine-specific)